MTIAQYRDKAKVSKWICYIQLAIHQQMATNNPLFIVILQVFQLFYKDEHLQPVFTSEVCKLFQLLHVAN